MFCADEKKRSKKEKEMRKLHSPKNEKRAFLALQPNLENKTAEQ